MGKRKEKRIARQKKVREKFYSLSQNGIQKFIKWAKIRVFTDKVVFLAENNRKVTFAITVTFLLLVVITSFVFRTTKKIGETYKEIAIEQYSDSTEIVSPIKSMQKRGDNIINSMEELIELQKIQNEFKDLQQKEKLTAEDSLRIIRIYNLINTKKHETK